MSTLFRKAPTFAALALGFCAACDAPAPAEPAQPALAPLPTGDKDPPAPGPLADASVVVSDLGCSPPQGPLGATLYQPATPPTQVAIVDVGAKAWDRWGNTEDASYNHYRDLAEGLSAGGVAVVLYDKRGTGASPGPYNLLPARVKDSEAMGACVAEALPGVGQIRVGHSMGSTVVARASSPPRLGTVMLSPLLPEDAWPEGPLLALQGTEDSPGPGEPVEGADHLLMRGGALAPEVVARILTWAATLPGGKVPAAAPAEEAPAPAEEAPASEEAPAAP